MTQSAIYLPDKRRVLYPLILMMLCIAGMATVGFAVYSSFGSTSTSGWYDAEPVAADLPAPPENFLFQPGIPASEAESINAAVPESTEPIAAATPLTILSGRATSIGQLSAVDCLTAAVYYEAASESGVGQRAVAQVILNRARHPAYPNSVCGVVFQGSSRSTGCQFSFTCDGSLARRPSTSGWAKARQVAVMALSGFVEQSVGYATHYHTVWVVPYWSSNLTKLNTIGAHIFYRWRGRSGTRAAFTNRYAQSEILPDALAARLPGYLLASVGTNGQSVPPGQDTMPKDQAGLSSEILGGLRVTNSTGLDVSKDSLVAASSDKRHLLVDRKATVMREVSRSLFVDRNFSK